MFYNFEGFEYWTIVLDIFILVKRAGSLECSFECVSLECLRNTPPTNKKPTVNTKNVHSTMNIILGENFKEPFK